jgi:hypothetical protein
MLCFSPDHHQKSRFSFKRDQGDGIAFTVVGLSERIIQLTRVPVIHLQIHAKALAGPALHPSGD